MQSEPTRTDGRPGPTSPGGSPSTSGLAQSPADAVVEAKGIGMVFSAGQAAGRVVALEDVDLTIRRGEFVSLIGPSGCGKSTFLRLVADLLQPSSGTLLVNGHPADVARQGREYGMVFQMPVLFDWRTVEQNVTLPLEVIGRGSSERRETAARLLDLMDLGAFRKHFPWQLSGGMQQRVAIARALALGPRILLMDEPFGALDEITRERLNLELHRIWRETGTTIIFITHSIPEAVFLSSRVVVMTPRPGRIVDVVNVDLGPDRTFETRERERYFELVTKVRESLRTDRGAGQPAVSRVESLAS